MFLASYARSLNKSGSNPPESATFYDVFELDLHKNAAIFVQSIGCSVVPPSAEERLNKLFPPPYVSLRVRFAVTRGDSGGAAETDVALSGDA